MIKANKKGSVAALPLAFCECSQITLYPKSPTPDKASRFEIDFDERSFKGQLPAMLRALATAGRHGIENRQCRLFSLNPGDHVAALRKRGVRIETRRGKPSRWILRSQVREVQ